MQSPGPHTKEKPKALFCTIKANLVNQRWKGMDEVSQGKASTLTHLGVLNGRITSEHIMTEHMSIGDQKGRKES